HFDFVFSFVYPNTLIRDGLFRFGELPLWTPIVNLGTSAHETLSQMNPPVLFLLLLESFFLGESSSFYDHGLLFFNFMLTQIFLFAPSCGLVAMELGGKPRSFWIGYWLSLFSGFFYLQIMFWSVYILFWPLFVYFALRLFKETAAARVNLCVQMLLLTFTLLVYMSTVFFNALTNAVLLLLPILFLTYRALPTRRTPWWQQLQWRPAYAMVFAFIGVLASLKIWNFTKITQSYAIHRSANPDLESFLYDVSHNTWRFMPVLTYLQQSVYPFFKPEFSYPFAAGVGLVAVFTILLSVLVHPQRKWFVLLVAGVLYTLLPMNPELPWNLVGRLLSILNPAYPYGTRFISASYLFVIPFLLAAVALAVEGLLSDAYRRKQSWKKLLCICGVGLFLRLGIAAFEFDYTTPLYFALAAATLSVFKPRFLQPLAVFLLCLGIFVEGYAIRAYHYGQHFKSGNPLRVMSHVPPLSADLITKRPFPAHIKTKSLFVTGSSAQSDYEDFLKWLPHRAFFLAERQLDIPLKACFESECRGVMFTRDQGINFVVLDSEASLPKTDIRQQLVYPTHLLWSYVTSEFVISNQEPGFFVYLDHYDEKWSAQVNGKSAPIGKFRQLYKTVQLQPGEHKIEFRYQDRGFYILNVMYYFAYVLCFLWLVWVCWKEYFRQLERGVQASSTSSLA
ncbi:MAG: hypothetical protein OXT67_04500, partial [Zetaproteobacteria bacterium]|nr:hypothetical protein [Zetaproteobacteria bacterium]